MFKGTTNWTVSSAFLEGTGQPLQSQLVKNSPKSMRKRQQAETRNKETEETHN